MINKISIKEAGRYSNFINEKFQEINMLAQYDLKQSMYKKIETHFKSKAYKEAVDEIVSNESEIENGVDLEKLESLVGTLILEKLELSKAITMAKESIVIDGYDSIGEVGLDTAIEYAKYLRAVSRDYYSAFIRGAESETKSTGKGHAFNIEGNQVPYVYEINTKTTFNYNKDQYVKKQKDISLLADKLSMRIDKAMSEEIVEFEPKYNYLDNLEELLKK